MTIEIRRAGFVNMGAYLMLLSVLESAGQKYPTTTFTMIPSTYNQQIENIFHLGMYPKVSLFWRRIQWGGIGCLIPKILRTQYGIILDNEVNLVLDAAGFAYGDQWGTGCLNELENSSRRWKRKGTAVVLLPQAFGPFTSNRMQRQIKKTVKNMDLIYAREQASYDNIVKVTGPLANLKIAPDFTTILPGKLPEGFKPIENCICIIPNKKMIDRTESQVSQSYLGFLKTCTTYILSKGSNVAFLIHEGEPDYSLAKEVCTQLQIDLPIIKEEDPLFIKGIIGTFSATIGSRFHGLVSALSQGVPSLATGWSHKYQMLMEDYGFLEGLLEDLCDECIIKKKIDMVIDPAMNLAIRKKLLTNSEKLKEKTHAMWEEIFELIESKQLSKRNTNK
ncbi:MAG: polysaccharide pyruvyl transferase family protein [Sphaerochaeta sp.]